MKTQKFEDIWNEEIGSASFSTLAGSGGQPVGDVTPSNYIGTACGKGKYKKRTKYLFQKRQLPEMLREKTDDTISDERLDKRSIGL